MAISTASVPPRKGQPAYKLLRLRKTGELSPLFINKRQIIPTGVWLKAENWPTDGFQERMGWHCSPQAFAPHLTTKGRIWMRVEVADFQMIKRPAFQGNAWYLANWMRVIEPVPAEEIL
jgi:hypothetical protein